MKNWFVRSHRGLLVSLLLLVSGTLPVSAFMPVIDAPHILETIHNGYLTYQSVQNTLQQLEYAYQTTQAQLIQLQKLDMSNISSFTDAVSFVDKQLSFVRRTEDRFKRIGVNVGGKNVPLSQFYRLPGSAVDMIKNDLTANMSDREKARAWSYYGLSPANYMYTVAIKGRLNEAAEQMTVIGDIIAENQEKTSEEVDSIMKEASKSESSLAVMQSVTAMMQVLIGQQMEANRLNALALRYQADKDVSTDLPVKPRATVSSDWLE